MIWRSEESCVYCGVTIDSTMKLCRQCNTNKPKSDFHKDKSTYDGVCSKCKDCKSEHNQQYRKDNKEYFDDYNRQYRIDNREEFLEKDRIRATKKRQSEGYGVYIILHKPTQSYYVGEGWLRNRRVNHFFELVNNKDECIGLQNFYNKHPNIKDYEFKVVTKWDYYNKVEGKRLEKEMIDEGLDNNSAQILNVKRHK
jgi:hypothetical protein